MAAPICVAGFTDSHWLREAFGTVAYGFFPARDLDAETAARLIHSGERARPGRPISSSACASCVTRPRPSVLEL